MKRSLFSILPAVALASFAHAASSAVRIEALPAVKNASPELEKSLRSMAARIRSDANDCLQNARGMDSIGDYSAALKKTVDTSGAVIIKVSGYKICDGVHTSSYIYWVALDKETGRSIDLEKIYQIAIRQDALLFIRPELVGVVRKKYAEANERNPSCLLNEGWEDELASFPVTFAPLPDGSIDVYFSAPEVSAACFSELHLNPGEFSRFRNADQASRYELP